MKRFFRDDIEYRIANLRFAIKDFMDEDPAELKEWSKGYREGKILSMESELRFLEGLVKEVGQD